MVELRALCNAAEASLLVKQPGLRVHQHTKVLLPDFNVELLVESPLFKFHLPLCDGIALL